ncbi:MAG: DUF3857 domain-containing protein [Muribaculaceae bacterium]|nr:DUF3857 domain-containing protein [Muribaculaceae bacterium]
MKTKYIRIIVAALLFITNASEMVGGIDKKFYSKTAEQVWSKDKDLFNPHIEIADSLTANNSAVILAWSDDVFVDRVVQNTIYSATGQTNRTDKKYTKRVMVKLLDQNAIDKYSEFEFGQKFDIKFRGSIIYLLNGCFGARIYKPNGTIIDVDMTQAVEIGDGKKGKDALSYKLAIPALEVGDILEYFVFENEIADGYDLNAQNFMIAAAYPVLNRRISFTCNPEITVEFKGYNGVPTFGRSTGDKNMQVATLLLHDIPGVNFSRFLRVYRQLPFIRAHYLNNNDKLIMSRNARNGGIYENLHTGKILSEFRDFLSEISYNSPLNKRAEKLVKDYYEKEHPEASAKDIANAAYMALNYVDLTASNSSDKSSGQFERALIFSDILTKMSVYPSDSIGIGLINPNSDIPMDGITAWNESRMVVKTPDRLYFMPRSSILAPGELPATYQGEKALLFYGDRKNLNFKSLVAEYIVPPVKTSDNSAVIIYTISISDDKLKVNSTITLSGGYKMGTEDFTDLNEWIQDVEDYFNIPVAKRFKDSNYDVQSREKELKENIAEAFKTLMGTKSDSISSVAFLKRGIRPDSSSIEMNATLSYSGLVESIGDDIIISVGKLCGMPEPIVDSERERLLDIMLPFVSRETHILYIKAPENYKFDEVSVNSLSKNSSNVLGQFYVNSELTEEGDLKITTVITNKVADIPLQFWPMFTELVDEEAAFADSTVILIKE